MAHRIIKILLLATTISLVSGCYYDVEEELYPSLECESTDMSYAMDIQPMLAQNCYQCHNAQANFGNVTLDSHDQLLTYVNNGKLLGVIRHQPGFPAMPQGQPQLVDCQIEKIENWIADGAPDN